MKAFRFETVPKGLELVDVPVPTPGKNQVLVKVIASGLCHTDCNVISGKDDLLFWQRPITLGHEVAGTISALGPAVTEFSVGERVVCIIGLENPITIHDVTTSAGIGYDGGYAEFAIFNTAKTLRIPEGVSFAQAAVATDAVATAYHAVVSEAQVSPSTTMAIIGLGGLGLSAVAIASLMGAKVYAIDLDSRKFAAALQSGALLCAKSIEKFSGIRFDAIVDFAGAGVTTASAVKATKSGGTVVLVGLASKECRLPTHDLVAQGVTLKGCAGSSREEVEKVLQHMSKGELNPILEEIPFLQVREGLDRLTKGTAVGRLYVDPSKA